VSRTVFGETKSATGPYLAPPARGQWTEGSVAVPSFSVTIPVYQGADTVCVAIDSALDQTVAPLEVIVCDDGSTDDLYSVLSRYDSRVTVLRQEHRGVAAARNLGLFHAKGDFVIVLDSDDAMLPRTIEALGAFAQARPDLDILCRNAYYVRDGMIVGLSRTEEEPRFPVDDQRIAILEGCFLPAHSAVRTSVLQRVGGYDVTVRAAVDYEAWVRLVFAGARAGLLLEPLHVYTQREGSLSTNSIWLIEGCMKALTKALSRADLTRGERSLAEERLRDLEAKLLRARAKKALEEGAPEARALSLKVALGNANPLSVRAKAAAAVLSPTVARRRLTGWSA
jgi:hypothetical protein